MAPRPLQEPLKRPQEAAKSAPGGPKRNPRDPRSRSRGLMTLRDRPKRLQKNTIPKLMVHINVAEIAEIAEDKKLWTRKGRKQGTGGRRCSPLGEAIRRPPRRGESPACRIARRGPKILAIDLCILLHIFFGGVFGPPLGPLQEGCAFRRAAPRGAQKSS